MSSPQDHPRRILLVVTGLSPQVVTETLWALTVGAEPARRFVPTEIHVLTTRAGAERIRLQLLSDEPGWFGRLRQDYALPPMAFDSEHVHVARDAAGRPLDDIRNAEDSEAVGDFIMEWVRRLTEDPQAAVHASIAGGRKTMGFYLGYALSLFGRPQDRLSHVLVDAPYESLPDFFYPASEERVVFDRNNNPLDASQAHVWLADIPFVRLREGLPRRLTEGEAGFAETIAAAQRAQQPPRVVVDLDRGQIVASGEAVHLPPADLAFYAMMARRRLRGKHALHPGRFDPDEYLDEYQRIEQARHDTMHQTLESMADKPDEQREWFNQRRSRVNGKLNRTLGEPLAKAYLIHAQGQRPSTRYGLTLDLDAIEIIDTD